MGTVIIKKEHYLTQIRFWVNTGLLGMEDLQDLYGEFYAQQEAETARMEEHYYDVL